jgi:hypothetical protein
MAYPTFDEAGSGSIRRPARGKAFERIVTRIRLARVDFTRPRWTNFAILGGCVAFWTEAIGHLIRII